MTELTQGFLHSDKVFNLRNVFIVGGIALLFTFLTKRLRPTGRDISNYADLRKYQELRQSYENTRVKRLVIERRVEDHFEFFCLSDTVNTNISHDYFAAANSNEYSVNSLFSCALLLMTISAVTTLVAAVYFFKSGAFKPGTMGMLDVVYGAVVMFLFIFAMIGVQTMASRMLDERKSCEKRTKKLGKALGKEEKRYAGLLQSLELYHSLEEHVRHEIRTSERFASLVKQKILAGKLSASCCEKIVNELERISAEQECIALYA